MFKAKPVLPWFPFYWNEFLKEKPYSEMSLSARGLFIGLCCLTWRDGGFPTDLHKLSIELIASRQDIEATYYEIIHLIDTEQGDTGFVPEVRRLKAARGEIQKRLSSAGKKGAKMRKINSATFLDMGKPLNR